jgi:hypothetical protein|tara:strand:- start:1321 stop:2223 length:903 start_codon:yes stop_codon:yes gene_type:complete
MLSVVSVAFFFGGVAWYNVLPYWWFVSMFLSVLSLTIHDMQANISDVFLNSAYKKMKPTECCSLSEHFKYPQYVLRTTVALRALAGMLACAAIVISWYCREDFATGHYYVVSGSWVLVTIVWVVSCIPMVVSLMQCAAVSDDAIIIQYRKTISVWIIHDVFLGLFWFYLSVMLYDLSDDSDDSEWRTIFLSMISWHIIIIVLEEIYMKRSPRLSKSCCGPGNVGQWARFFLLLAFVGIYLVVIWRMQDNELTKLGMSSGSFILFSCCTFVAYLCKSNIRPDQQIIKRDSNNPPTRGGLHF